MNLISKVRLLCSPCHRAELQHHLKVFSCWVISILCCNDKLWSSLAWIHSRGSKPLKTGQPLYKTHCCVKCTLNWLKTISISQCYIFQILIYQKKHFPYILKLKTDNKEHLSVLIFVLFVTNEAKITNSPIIWRFHQQFFTKLRVVNDGFEIVYDQYDSSTIRDWYCPG